MRKPKTTGGAPPDSRRPSEPFCMADDRPYGAEAERWPFWLPNAIVARDFLKNCIHDEMVQIQDLLIFVASAGTGLAGGRCGPHHPRAKCPAGRRRAEAGPV